MSRFYQVVRFSLDRQNYAVPRSQVERVVQVVEIAPLPKAPEIVLGIVNFSGQLQDGLIFLHDLERFLSLDEEGSLEQALQVL